MKAKVILLCCLLIWAIEMEAEPSVDLKDVYVDISINRIDEIDFNLQTFKVDFYMEMWWPAVSSGIEPVDAGGPRAMEVSEKDLAWKPVNEFNNVKEIELLSETPCQLTGNWLMRISRYKGVFYSDMDLRAFPFDEHHLYIILEDVNRDNGALQYRYGSPMGWHPEDDTVVLSSDRIFETTLDFPEYTIDNQAAFSVGIHKYETSYETREYSQAKVTFRIIRKPGFYFSKVLLVVLILAVSGLFIYFIPREDNSGRLGYGITVLLAMIGHNFATKDMMPMVSYLTTMDLITISSNALIFFLLLSTLYRRSGKKNSHLAGSLESLPDPSPKPPRS